jgi:hypothetical protein
MKQDEASEGRSAETVLQRPVVQLQQRRCKKLIVQHSSSSSSPNSVVGSLQVPLVDNMQRQQKQQH